ncbi:MAG: ABC transporter ATP-binding protein [Negativicutes bacterium]|jgi:ATP-binding cassette subfamily B protein
MFKLLRDLYFIWRPYRRRFVSALAVNLLSAPLIYMIPLIMGRVWDNVLPYVQAPGGYIRLTGYCALMLLFAVLHNGFNYLMVRGCWSTAIRVERDLRLKLFAHLQRLSFAYHGQNRIGDTMYCLTNDLMGIRNFFAYGAEQRVQLVVYFVVGVILLGIIDWQLMLMALAVFPLVGVVLYRYNKKIEVAVKESRDRYGELSTIIQENINGVRVVRAFAMEAQEHEKFMDKAQQSYNSVCSLIRLYFNTYPIFLLFSSVCNIILVCFGGWQVINGDKTVGTLISVFGCLYFLQWPLILIAMNSSQISSTQYSLQQVQKILDVVVDPCPPKPGRVLADLRGEISFEAVSFAYGENEVLREVDLTIKAGEKIAVFGTAGSGKTTLVSLAPRFIDPTAGRITIDGVDLRELDLDWWRKNIGYSLQETFLFSMSIRDNISFGHFAATEEQIELAAKTAHVHDFIMTLPQGYDTVIGEKGVGLSGGQKQRIALARALLTNPRILILDDATTAVDNITERIIQENMQEALAGRTAIIVTQRVSTAAIADRIIVLEAGKITAVGTKNELINRPGLFADIYRMQFEAG